MKGNKKEQSEMERLEHLWSGDFGDEYTERNLEAYRGREPFWKSVISKYDIQNVLEVGCNIGANLYWIAKMLPPKDVYGVDINEKALSLMRKQLPRVNTTWAPARELPFRDEWFDLVFTTGVLIHQPPDALTVVMSEIVRCAKRFVLCGEYYSEKLTEVEYRGQSGALFKQDYGKIYLDLFPDLELIQQGFLPKSEGGWDNLTYWIFQKC